MSIFHFKLKHPEQIAPWGIAQEQNMHWFGLSDGQYWMELNGSYLYEYSEKFKISRLIFKTNCRYWISSYICIAKAVQNMTDKHINMQDWRGSSLLIAFILLVLSPYSVGAQSKQAGLWYVGSKCLDFSTSPVSISDLPAAFIGNRNFVYADKNGKLVLVISAEKIYNKNFLPIKSGDGIAVPTYSALFAPKPNNDTLVYYISGASYCIIDTKNDTVIEKNKVWNSFTERVDIYACYHSNCKDTWLICATNDGLYSYLLTKNGISKDYSSFDPETNRLYYGSLSPSGRYFCTPRLNTSTSSCMLSFVNFNKNTGAFESKQEYNFLKYGLIFTCAFSKDESKLYLYMQLGQTRTYHTYQINIANGIPDFQNAMLVNIQNTCFGMCVVG